MTRRYTSEQIQSYLAQNLPQWALQDEHLTRSYRTGGWQMTVQVANTIAFLAEIAWHHPELVLSYAKITVRLQTHDAGGITDKDFELAAQIEAVVTWRPQPDAALSGHEDRQIR